MIVAYCVVLSGGSRIEKLNIKYDCGILCGIERGAAGIDKLNININYI